MNRPVASPPTQRESGLNWRQVGILYRREFRAALREKTILFNSILIPIFLYPFLLWAAFTGMMFVMGQTESLASRVAVGQWPEQHPRLRRQIERHKQIEIARTVVGEADASEAIRRGELDARIDFRHPDGKAGEMPGNFEASITFDQSKDRSVAARERIQEIIEDYRTTWVERETMARGIHPARWQTFTLDFQNLASESEMGAFVLGLMLPIIFVVMVAVGCFYPAVDAVAGERERGTWETLMSTSATRPSVVAGKYLYVATMGGLAGALNVGAVLLTVKPVFAPLFEEAGRSLKFSLPLSSVPILMLAAVLLAGFVAAGMMLFATFARTFKEGQSMITPFYMLILLPVVFLQVPGLKLTAALALIPVVNITLMLRESISGDLQWLPMLVTLIASAGAILLILRLAAFVLKFEDVVSGTFQGSLFKLLRLRLRKTTRGT